MPRSTLGDQISGRVVPGSTSGPPKYLSTQEEELVQFLMDCTSSGVARPKLMVGPDYRGTKEVLEDLALAAPG